MLLAIRAGVPPWRGNITGREHVDDSGSRLFLHQMLAAWVSHLWKSLTCAIMIKPFSAYMLWDCRRNEPWFAQLSCIHSFGGALPMLTWLSHVTYFGQSDKSKCYVSRGIKGTCTLGPALLCYFWESWDFHCENMLGLVCYIVSGIV
jgi:hypothetical protein